MRDMEPFFYVERNSEGWHVSGLVFMNEAYEHLFLPMPSKKEAESLATNMTISTFQQAEAENRRRGRRKKK